MDQVNLLEERRLQSLYSYGILDTEDEESFTSIADNLSCILKIPTVLISFMDRDRQWFKACIQFNHKQTSRQVSFCTYTIMQDAPFVVEDATTHPLFHDNPLVTHDPHIRAYLGVPLKTPDGHRIGTICAIDYQQRQFTDWDIEVIVRYSHVVMTAMEQRLLRKEHELTALELQAVMRHAPVGFVLLNGQGQVVGVNPEAVCLTGLHLQLGGVFEQNHLVPTVEGHHIYRHATQEKYFQLSRSTVRDDLALLVVTDATEHVQRQMFLQDLAYLDALTGLPNRKAFELKLQSIPDLSQVAVAFIDLDGFKAVNDTFGHGVGDLLLQEVAWRLKSTLRTEDQVFRLAGDEFTLLLPTPSKEVLEGVALRVMASLQEPFSPDGKPVVFGASMGITVGVASDHPETLLERADRLMYQVKKTGKNHHLFG